MPAVSFTTKDFTRAHSFFTPLAKSRGPYSNSTTKLKVKTMKRTNQKNPRRSAMQQGSRFKPCDQWHYGVNAVVEFFQQRSTISARMRRLAAASILLTAQGRYRSGQTGQTVNLLAYAFAGSNPALPRSFACATSVPVELACTVPRRQGFALSDQNPLRQRTLNRLFSDAERARSVASSLAATFAAAAVSPATTVAAAPTAATGRS